MRRRDAPDFITGRLHDQLLYANISIIQLTSNTSGASGRGGRAAVVQAKKRLPAATLPPYLPPAPASAAPLARPPHTPRQHGQTGAGPRTSSPPAAANVTSTLYRLFLVKVNGHKPFYLNILQYDSHLFVN